MNKIILNKIKKEALSYGLKEKEFEDIMRGLEIIFSCVKKRDFKNARIMAKTTYKRIDAALERLDK
jgi:predicted house-cleaning noncanonical NTP pyrophosphatase (MazG superfamily)